MVAVEVEVYFGPTDVKQLKVIVVQLDEPHYGNNICASKE